MSAAAASGDAMGTSTIETLLKPIDPPCVDSGGRGAARWLTAGAWRVLAATNLDSTPSGEELERFSLESGRVVSAVRRSSDGRVVVPFDLDDAYANYVTERWREQARVRALRPGQLQLYYRLKRFVPRSLQLRARRALIRRNGVPSFPAWPIEDGVTSLARFYAACLLAASDAEEAEFVWFWPHGHRAAAILTHDVESAAGLRLALELADLEQARGFRSSFNIVAGDYRIDTGIVEELAGRGFEIGLHGLHHDRSLFASRDAFEHQLPQLATAARRLGATGFRSPATHRVIAWLEELPVSYDCSVPHSDPFEPQPGGCCSVWPFTLGRLVELPYTLSQDHTLFTLLGHRTIDPWLAQVEAIEQRHGLIQCLSHPDPGYLGDRDKRALYASFLDALAEREGIWHALPREVAAWWRRRAAADPRDPGLHRGTMRRSGRASATLAPHPRTRRRTAAASGILDLA